MVQFPQDVAEDLCEILNLHGTDPAERAAVDFREHAGFERITRGKRRKTHKIVVSRDQTSPFPEFLVQNVAVYAALLQRIPVLVLGETSIGIAALIGARDSRLSSHPLNLAIYRWRLAR